MHASIGHTIEAFPDLVTTNSIRVVAITGDDLVPRPHLFRHIRRHQASQLHRLPNVSDNKYPRIDVREKNEVMSCAPKQSHAITKSTQCPKVGKRSRGRMQGAGVNRFSKGGVLGIVDVW